MINHTVFSRTQKIYDKYFYEDFNPLCIYTYSRFKKYDEDFNPGDEPTLYAYWAASVIGPVVHGLALVYALMFFNKVITLIGRIIGTIVSLQHFLLCCHVQC